MFLPPSGHGDPEMLLLPVKQQIWQMKPPCILFSSLGKNGSGSLKMLGGETKMCDLCSASSRVAQPAAALHPECEEMEKD